MAAEKTAFDILLAFDSLNQVRELRSQRS
jgi:hypothetical protein